MSGEGGGGRGGGSFKGYYNVQLSEGGGGGGLVPAGSLRGVCVWGMYSRQVK